MTDYGFCVTTDDPFHIKKELAKSFPGLDSAIIDLSRGEPFNPPDVTSDEVFAAFFNLSLEVTRRIGDRNIKTATQQEVNAALAALGERQCIGHGDSTKSITSVVRQIARIMRDQGCAVDEHKLLTGILSDVRGEDYGDVEGQLPVRCLVAKKLKDLLVLPHSVDVKPGGIVLTIGGSEGIGALFEILLCLGLFKANDRMVAMISPLYTPYKFILDRCNVRIVGVRSPADHGFEPSEASLREFETVAPEVDVLVMVNPSNPGARAISGGRLRDLAQICRQHRIIVIEDIVYAQFLLKRMDTMANNYPERTIIVSSGSKFYQEPGTRFGYIWLSNTANDGITDLLGRSKICGYYGAQCKDFLDAINMAKGPDSVGTFYHTHFVPTPVQWLGAFRMLYGEPDARAFVDELWTRWNALYHGLGLSTPAETFPQGDFVPYYALIDFLAVMERQGHRRLVDAAKRGAIPPEELVVRLYRDAHVRILPAATFYPEAPAEHAWEVRFSVANQTVERVEEATRNILGMLRRWNEEAVAG